MINSSQSARYILALSIIAILTLSGCSALPHKQATELTTINSNIAQNPIDIYDPFENFNRGTYRFNAQFDRYLFLPAVNAYEWLTPDPLEKGVSNFFDNIFELNTLTNAIFQLKPKTALETAERFVINSTIGIAGLFDVASTWGINQHHEDFGQTLGFYGVEEGPYLVLPILGPSNLRDTGGLATDTFIFASLIDPLDFENSLNREITFYLLHSIDTRHNSSFRYYDSGSPFEYELIRLLYTEKRKLDILR